MILTQGSIPEVRESSIGQALKERHSRLSTFSNNLGPADLISIHKYIPASGTSATRDTSSISNSNNTNNNGSNGNATQSVINYRISSESSMPHHQQIAKKLELGTYLYCSGVDTSDPNSIAVFCKSIQDAIEEKPQLWFGKNRNFKISEITYSSWNTFSSCDVNVVVHFPGTLQTYLTTATDGDISLDTDEESSGTHASIWLETFVCTVVRSFIQMLDNRNEGEINNVVETIILNPLMMGEITDVAELFISKGFPLCYTRGSFLGSPIGIVNTSNINNYLVETFVKITKLSHNADLAIDVLRKMLPEYPELSVVLSRIYFENDFEIDAFKLLHSELLKSDDVLPYKSDLLCVEAEYLFELKSDYTLALQVSQNAVKYGPSEFRTWYWLVKSYIALNDVKNALLALNSSPMTLNKEKYNFKRCCSINSPPVDSSTTNNSKDNDNKNSALHLPLPVDVILDEVTGLNSQDVINEHKSADPILLNLPASSLQATFQLAYGLLAEIGKKTGWENLLKLRAENFVMEEEFTNNKNKTIRDKRLCERWLDNLFMLLYQDMKQYTMWQAEQLHFEATNTEYHKTTFEWELLGLCATRLKHDKEASEAFQYGLQQRFSATSCRKLLQYYVAERTKLKKNYQLSSQQILTTLNTIDNLIIDLVVKICCWNHRWYGDFSLLLLESLNDTLSDMGLTKVCNEVDSRYPESVTKLFKSQLLQFFEKHTKDQFDM
ncbi:related to Bud site selection protein 7 [Saccharomycodes ludwigii]|uniref:Related to Bud site selection protein 7 n=1 Tax=Saccharomycodes ludwigii TaxID=36035 RepID=A0A376B4A4_9ASCO|nr:hypothetical protein SCDLUD_000803 [Saccharomycodes ludwigii]KAH3903186.1 hypothetical protein SCDLUD_000803 [Saccharomycodes ludwigii]SSD59442.1 related to Bud site selection protein 7 [Saccharomycodes ludwigii]